MTTRTASSTTRSSSKAKTKGKTGFTTRESARLHPQTVTNYKGSIRKAPRKPGKPSRITTLRVDPRIWEAALSISQGDAHRIEVISELEVIVHNNPRKKR